MEKGGIIKYDQKKSPKTGDWRYMKPEVNVSKCNGCNICVLYCPEAAIELASKKSRKNPKIAEIDFDYCKGCGVCAEICPTKAIIMKR